MKTIILGLLTSLSLLACGVNENDSTYLDHRVLIDSHGCAFVFNKSGTNVLPFFYKEKSSPSCLFIPDGDDAKWISENVIKE